jgi:hypothetical protein
MSRTWDVNMGPFKKTMVAGALVPSALAPVQFLRWSKRRVAVELYGEPTASGPTGGSGEADASASDKFPLADSDVLYLRIYKQQRSGGSNRRGGRRLRLSGGGHRGADKEDDDVDEDNQSLIDTDDDASLVSGVVSHESCTLFTFPPALQSVA